MPEAEATEATIKLMYKAYYAEMGGAGTPPDVPARAARAGRRTGNVTAFRRPARQAEGGSLADRTRSRGRRWR